MIAISLDRNYTQKVLITSLCFRKHSPSSAFLLEAEIRPVSLSVVLINIFISAFINISFSNVTHLGGMANILCDRIGIRYNLDELG